MKNDPIGLPQSDKKIRLLPKTPPTPCDADSTTLILAKIIFSSQRTFVKTVRWATSTIRVSRFQGDQSELRFRLYQGGLRALLHATRPVRSSLTGPVRLVAMETCCCSATTYGRRCPEAKLTAGRDLTVNVCFGDVRLFSEFFARLFHARLMCALFSLLYNSICAPFTP